MNAEQVQSKTARSWPLAGVALVFRQRRSGRTWRREAALIGGLLVALALLSAWLQSPERWNPQASIFYLSVNGGFGMRWLLMSVLSALFLLLPVACVVGAGAVPTTLETEATQAMLLTRLSPLAICSGRLLAALWPLMVTLAVSYAFWLVVASGERFGMSGEVLLAHGVLLCAVFAAASLGFLGAQRSRPGRAWGRGTALAMGVVVLCLTAILLANPQIRKMDDPTLLIERTLLINPASAVATSLQLDILRTHWLYPRTDAHDFPYAYPSPLASATLFVSVGLLAQWLSGYRLRRAFR